MEDDADPPTPPALSALYDRYFTVVPATTPALLDAAYRLRYQVYCVEHSFEDPARQVGEREIDRYDAHSVHAVLSYTPTGAVVGCVRLILPQANGDISTLPMRDLLGQEDRARLDRHDPSRTAEISRYAVSKMFRRRKEEDLYPDVGIGNLTTDEARRLVPHVSLGLFRGIALLAGAHGITTVCAAMAPALLRLLKRFDLAFESIGPLIDHHGLRQPCIANSEELLAGMAARHADYFRLIDAEFRKNRSTSDVSVVRG